MARDLYRRVDDQRHFESVKENEVRVTAGGKQRAVITYAVALLEERQAKEITVRALGQAIYKAVGIVEIVKRRVPGLHQITQLDSVETVERHEPIQEGLEPIVGNRTVSSIVIRLSVVPPADITQPGYQRPIDESQVRPGLVRGRDGDRGRGRGRGRGGRGRARGRNRGYSTYTQLNAGGASGDVTTQNTSTSTTANAQPSNSPVPTMTPPTTAQQDGRFPEQYGTDQPLDQYSEQLGDQYGDQGNGIRGRGRGRGRARGRGRGRARGGRGRARGFRGNLNTTGARPYYGGPGNFNNSSYTGNYNPNYAGYSNTNFNPNFNSGYNNPNFNPNNNSSFNKNAYSENNLNSNYNNDQFTEGSRGLAPPRARARGRGRGRGGRGRRVNGGRGGSPVAGTNPAGGLMENDTPSS